MTRARSDPRSNAARTMRADRGALRVYGPLWPLLADIWELAPHTGQAGMTTLIQLCAPDADVAEFITLLRRPPSAGRPAPLRSLGDGLPSCRPRAEPWETDRVLVAWVGDDPARRLWAVTALAWGLTPAQVCPGFDDLVAVTARPRPTGLPTVQALSDAPPGALPRQLRAADRPIEEVCAEFADDLGLTPGSELSVTLPAALGAIAAALAADSRTGIAAVATLVRARHRSDFDPPGLIKATRPGTAAHAVASALAGLWEQVRRSHAGATPTPPA